MFKPAARFFANLAVGKKLLIGFGLVLLLTAAMTVSGYLAVQAVLHGHEQVGELAQVNQEILEARRLERNFAIEQTQESAERGPVVGAPSASTCWSESPPRAVLNRDLPAPVGNSASVLPPTA